MSSKDKSSADCKPPSSGDATWTYEVPFQYVWVAAEAMEMSLGLERAAAFMEAGFPFVCRVRIDLAVPGSQESVSRFHAWRLRASCPFCDAGKDQVLDSGNWLNIVEWDEDLEGDLLHGFPWSPRRGSRIGINTMHELGGLERALDWRIFAKPMRLWALKACLAEHPSIPREGFPDLEATPVWVPSEGINVYGVSLAEVYAALEGDESVECSVCEAVSSEHESEPIAREFGVEGYFGGLYRCAHCGNAFAIDYHDPYDDTRDGRYKILPEVSEVIDRLVARKGFPEAVSDGSINATEHESTMSAIVSQEGSHVTLRANIAGRNHELVFDTALGSFLLDGDACVNDDRAARNPIPHLEIHWDGVNASATIRSWYG